MIPLWKNTISSPESCQKIHIFHEKCEYLTDGEFYMFYFNSEITQTITELILFFCVGSCVKRTQFMGSCLHKKHENPAISFNMWKVTRIRIVENSFDRNHISVVSRVDLPMLMRFCRYPRVFSQGVRIQI